MLNYRRAGVDNDLTHCCAMNTVLILKADKAISCTIETQNYCDKQSRSRLLYIRYIIRRKGSRKIYQFMQYICL